MTYVYVLLAAVVIVYTLRYHAWLKRVSSEGGSAWEIYRLSGNYHSPRIWLLQLKNEVYYRDTFLVKMKVIFFPWTFLNENNDIDVLREMARTHEPADNAMDHVEGGPGRDHFDDSIWAECAHSKMKAPVNYQITWRTDNAVRRELQDLTYEEVQRQVRDFVNNGFVDTYVKSLTTITLSEDYESGGQEYRAMIIHGSPENINEMSKYVISILPDNTQQS